MLDYMNVNAVTNKELFQVYINEILLLKLFAGDIMIMDNLSSHKNQNVKKCKKICRSIVEFFACMLNIAY